MTEISVQAVLFIPRISSVLVLILLTWLVARFSKSMILRASHLCSNCLESEGRSRKLPNVVFWAIILAISPFILGAIGLEFPWLVKVQAIEGQVFSNWAIWMFLSLLVAAISYLVGSVSKMYVQIKKSYKNSYRNELQN